MYINRLTGRNSSVSTQIMVIILLLFPSSTTGRNFSSYTLYPLRVVSYFIRNRKIKCNRITSLHITFSNHAISKHADLDKQIYISMRCIFTDKIINKHNNFG